MPSIKPSYQIVLYHQTNYILVQFPSHALWNKRMQSVHGSRWSKTFKGWLIPETEENRVRCGISIKNNGTVLQHRHIIAEKSNQFGLRGEYGHVNPQNHHELKRFHEQLLLKKYSSSTIKTYCNELTQLLNKLGNVQVTTLSPDLLRRYMIWCVKQGYSENTLHSRLNALKFYFEQVLKKEKMFFEIPRPKKPFQLPKLLNEAELARLFNAIANRKHKAMLFTAYSAGLRVSEVTALKIADIDSKRMQIFIGRSKGKKDRYVNLSPLLLDISRQYFQLYYPKPKLYLFESEQTGTAYPTRTVQQIFSNARHKAGIHKSVGVHSLRHSFATHLLDKGTDIKYIKDLLGHFDIRTTERYLHVSKKQLINIVSPLDDLWRNEEINW